MERKPLDWGTTIGHEGTGIRRTMMGDCQLEVWKSPGRGYFWAVSYAYEDGLAENEEEAMAAATRSAAALAKLMRLRPMQNPRE